MWPTTLKFTPLVQISPLRPRSIFPNSYLPLRYHRYLKMNTKIKLGVGVIAQWWSMRLASTRPWVQSPVPLVRGKIFFFNLIHYFIPYTCSSSINGTIIHFVGFARHCGNILISPSLLHLPLPKTHTHIPDPGPVKHQALSIPPSHHNSSSPPSLSTAARCAHLAWATPSLPASSPPHPSLSDLPPTSQ